LRATTFGISHYDLLAANEGAHDPASWSAGLVKFADRYAAAAQQATAAHQPQSARQWWQMAVNYYHFTQMFIEAAQRETYRMKCWQAYQQLAALVEPGCQRVAIPYQGLTLPGYLRVAQPGAPCVILLGGFEFAKEAELHQWGEYFLERGLSVLAFDGPGQGEVADQSTMRGDFETVIAAAIDFLARQGEPVDATRIGLCGVSLGGYMAMCAAALEKRVTACISLSGPFDGSTTRNLAPRNQKVTARLFGFDDVEQLIDPDGPINLAALPQAMTQPLFLIHGTLDHIVPTEQVERIRAWAQGETELWMLDGVEHCCFSRACEVMPTAGDWMARQLRAQITA
jgi:2,6-dihydroxypseudooxynicotine hydrolase